MPAYSDRLDRFRRRMEGKADFAFFGVSADLQYLIGVERPLPNFGAVMHPGAWAEGLWVPVNGPATLLLTRMSSEFSGLSGAAKVEPRLLADDEDPAAGIKGLLEGVRGNEGLRVLLDDRALAETASQLHRIVPAAEFGSSTELLREQRAIKDEQEMEIMRRAGEITQRAFRAVLPSLAHGMTESAVISEIELQLRREGSRCPSFATALYCSGPGHALIFGRPALTGPRELQPPVALLFDFGAVYKGYCYDFGRTIFFGEPPQEMREIHRVVMDAQAAGIQALSSGRTAQQVDTVARTRIEKAGYGEAFRHRLGHGIGLDVHEPPFLTQGDRAELKSGMLFTVEPSITQFEGYSARVEDVVAVSPSGGRPLTEGFQDLIVIE